MRKKLPVILCLAAVLLMSGCKINNVADVNNKTLQRTASAVKAAGNYTGYGRFDMVLTSNEGENVSSVETLVNADIGKEAKYDVQVVSNNETTGSSSATEMFVYAKEADSFRTYARASEDQWVYQNLESSSYTSVVGAYDMSYVISNYLQFASWKEAGTETVTLMNGEETVNCMKFTGTVKGDNVSTMVGVDGSIGHMGLTGVKEKHYDNRTAVPMTIWIAEDTFLPAKVVVDYTDAFRKVVENVNKAYTGDDENIKSRGIEKFTYELCFLGFDTTEVNMPAGAENAVEFEEYTASQAEK